MTRATEPTCSLQLLRPFARLLRTYDPVPHSLIERLSALEAGSGRAPLSTCLSLLEDATALTGDSTIGLRGALFTELGDFEVLEWVATSAATWREATETACRYVRILNEAAEYRLHVCGDKAHPAHADPAAMHYLRNTAHSVEDIAFLLGFSECPSFVRAFKRWSGHAPLEYRRLHAARTPASA